MPKQQNDETKRRKSSHGADFFPPLRREQEQQIGQKVGDESEIEEEEGGQGEEQSTMSNSPLGTSGLWLSNLGKGVRRSKDVSDEKDDDDQSTMNSFFSGGRGTVTTASLAAADPRSMESLVTAEMNQLGQEGRMLAYEDLHGVSKDREPDSDTIASHIDKLQIELKRIRERSALDKAMFLDPKYAMDPAFCTMFLRAERFNIKSAARRLVLHFKHKLELFGLEKVARDITLDDLSADDKVALYTGSEQYLSIDQSGRTILFSTIQLRTYKNIENQMRAIWYLSMQRLHGNENIQQNGVVVLRYDVGLSKSRTFMIGHDNDSGFSGKSCSLLAALPLKIKSFHFCYDNVELLTSLIASQMVIGRDLRVRFRAHEGSHEECLQALRTYGIPKEVLPLDQDGGIVSNNLFQLYMKECEKREHQSRTFDAASNNAPSILPSISDVLLGRGRPYQEYPGNLRLARLIDDHREEYSARAKSRKIEITNRILNIVSGSGGRFLKKSSKKDGGCWVEASADDAREKVSHGFRAKSKRLPPSPRQHQGGGGVARRTAVGATASEPGAVMPAPVLAGDEKVQQRTEKGGPRKTFSPKSDKGGVDKKKRKSRTISSESQGKEKTKRIEKKKKSNEAKKSHP